MNIFSDIFRIQNSYSLEGKIQDKNIYTFTHCHCEAYCCKHMEVTECDIYEHIYIFISWELLSFLVSKMTV